MHIGLSFLQYFSYFVDLYKLCYFHVFLLIFSDLFFRPDFDLSNQDMFLSVHRSVSTSKLFAFQVSLHVALPALFLHQMLFHLTQVVFSPATHEFTRLFFVCSFNQIALNMFASITNFRAF